MRFSATLLTLLLAGCGGGPYQAVVGELDDGARPHHSRLLSAEIANPTEAQKASPVMLATHGFSATEVENQVPVADMRAQGWLVSEVLLGAHGTSLQDFSTSTWRTWQAPVVAEYQALVAKGYTDIGLLASSTGATLLLEAMSRDALVPPPRRIAFLAPIVEVATPSKLLGYAGVLGWFGVQGNEVARTGAFQGNWYRFRPIATLTSLLELCEIAKSRLAQGVALPTTSRVLLIQSRRDPTVDPRSADMVQAGVHGATLRVRWVDADFHVPTWPNGIIETPADRALRDDLVLDIRRHLTP